MSPANECCEPGDVILTKVYSGWLLGHALEAIGPGPWWSYIAIVKDFDTALHQGRTIARNNSVALWFERDAETFIPIALDDSPFKP